MPYNVCVERSPHSTSQDDRDPVPHMHGPLPPVLTDHVDVGGLRRIVGMRLIPRLVHDPPYLVVLRMVPLPVKPSASSLA